MSETVKNLVEAAAEAAKALDAAQAARLQGMIQGYAAACDQQSDEKKNG